MNWALKRTSISSVSSVMPPTNRPLIGNDDFIMEFKILRSMPLVYLSLRRYISRHNRVELHESMQHFFLYFSFSHMRRCVRVSASKFQTPAWQRFTRFDLLRHSTCCPARMTVTAMTMRSSAGCSGVGLYPSRDMRSCAAPARHVGISAAALCSGCKSLDEIVLLRIYLSLYIVPYSTYLFVAIYWSQSYYGTDN